MTEETLTETIELRSQETLKILPENKLNDLTDRFEDKRFRLATRLLFRGGLRLCECFQLTWKDLEKKEGCLEIEVNTEESDRKIPIINAEELIKLLEEFREDEGEVLDFSKNTYRDRLKQKSGGELTPSILRDSRAYHLANQPHTDLSNLSWYFGWKHPETAQKYLNHEEQKAVME